MTLETAGLRDSERAAIFTPAQVQAALDSIVSKAQASLAGDGASNDVDDEFRARSVLLANADFDFRDFEATVTHPVSLTKRRNSAERAISSSKMARGIATASTGVSVTPSAL